MEATKGQLEETKVVVPTEIVEAMPESPHGDDVRKAIEKQAMAKNEEIPVVQDETSEVVETPEKKPQEVAKQEMPEEDNLDKIKKSVQKRIGKLTAKTKTLEEQLAEKEAELEALRNAKVEPKAETTEIKREPTMEECRKALAKAASEGDWDFHAQVTEYMAEAKAKLQRQEAEKVFSERTTKQTEAQKKQQADWIALNRDYEVTGDDGKPDTSSDMTLANQNGLLYKTAINLFKDPDVNVKYAVKNPDGSLDTIMGFRLAVNDAYRGLIEQGHYQPVKKVVEGKPKLDPKRQLAVPESDGSDDLTPQAPSNLSDAEKASYEIKSRMTYLNKRMAI